MDIINENYLETLNKFQNTLKSTKHKLAQLNTVSESIKTVEPKQITDPLIDFGLSSLCTKWMQFNAALPKLESIDINDTAKSTANQLVLYSILDEFKLNDSQKPHSPNINVERKSGYIGLGFISHIANESQGTAYVLDVMSMPDPLVMYGSTPKPMTRVPEPGEMFAYVYQEKYLVRAVRLKLEYRDQNSSANLFSAMLIDIGCVVRIESKPNCRDLYEVTKAGKTIPAYAKLCHLVQIPPNKCVVDLLHTRVHYKVILNDGNQMFVNILNEGANPFAAEQQKEFNFYMYFFGHNVKIITPSKVTPNKVPNKGTSNITTSGQHQSITKSTKTPSPIKRDDNSFNPFANTSQYEIKSVVVTPLNDKRNPFYIDTNNNDAVSTKPKFLNFTLTKILNNLSDEWIEKNLPNQRASTDQEIINNKTPLEEVKENGTNEIITKKQEASENEKNQSITKNHEFRSSEKSHVITNGTNEKSTKCKSAVEKENITSNSVRNTPNGFEKEILVHSSPVPARTATETNHITKPAKENEEQKTNGGKQQLETKIQHWNNFERERELVCSWQEPIQHAKPIRDEPKKQLQSVQQSKSSNQIETTKNIKDKTTSSVDYPKPKKLPAIGDKLTIMMEFVETVDKFYAVIWDDRLIDMKVDEFSALMNKEEHTKKLSKYNLKAKPKLFEKVIAQFENWYCRAKVVKVIDEHVFQVYFVDYGNCAKVGTLELYKYDEKWDKYPAYALNFRINGIKETIEYDFAARRALEQIMNAECEATIVDIEHCEKLNRDTYVVDLLDENGLNIAETILHKGYGVPFKHLPNHASLQ